MPIKNYGVWVGYPKSHTAERNIDDPKSPHISLYYDDSAGGDNKKYRAAINVKSATEESRLVYWFVRNFDEPILEHLQTLDSGFHSLPSSEKQGLDYIRGNLMTFEQGTLVLHDVEGENNDIIDYISPILNNAIQQSAKIFLFGEPFPDGIHDVHMNQGNEGNFKRDNGVWQDGGIILSFPDGHSEAIFLAFAVQKVHTDDNTGHPLGPTNFATLLSGKETPTTPDPRPSPRPEHTPDGVVFIKAALVNPEGPDLSADQKEKVYLHNRTESVIELDGWKISNNKGQTQNLGSDFKLPKGGDRGILVPQCPLSNRGGTITLLNKSGLKVDGVSYTKAQAGREGRLIYFH